MPRALALVILPLCATLSACSSATAENPIRVLAVGDLHADANQAQKALQLAGVVDDKGHWAAGKAVFVQTGDVTDRGPDSKKLMDLMDRLRKEASEAGGEVRSLIGNHESMNLLGDWRYVHPLDVEQFGGLEARVAAFGEGGPYAKWVQERDLVTKVGDVVFCHGGVTPEWAEKGVDGINAAGREALNSRNMEAPVLGTDGPLWYRGYVLDDESVACPKLDEALEHLEAKRMVVGHTTQRDGRVQTRCDGKLTVIDIGIAGHYGGHAGAWEMVGGDARAMYVAGPEDLEDPTP